MNLELYKQQGLDLFKRFEIALPQKKTAQALQIGVEHFIKKEFTKDGKYMLGFSNEGTSMHLTIYELPSAKCLFYYIYTDFNFWNVEVLPTNQVLINASYTNKIMLVSIPSGEIIHAFEGKCFGDKSADGMVFKVEINDNPFIYLPPNELIAIPVSSDKINEISFSPNYRYAVVCYKHQLNVWNLETRSIDYSITDTYKITNVSFSLDDTYLMVNFQHAEPPYHEGKLNTYLLASGQLFQSLLRYLDQPEMVPFSKGFVVFDNRNLFAFYPATNLYKELKGNAALMDCFVCEFDGNAYLILRSSPDYRKYSIVAYILNRLYNTSGEPEPVFSKIYTDIASVEVSISPDKRTMAVYVADCPFEFYHIGSFELYGELPGKYNLRLEFAANSKNIFITRNEKFFVYDLQTLKLHNNPIASIDTSAYDTPSKTLAIVNSDHYLNIRNLKTGEIVHKCIHSEYEFSQLMLFKNKRLFYGSSNAPLKIYNVETGDTNSINTPSGFPYVENQRYLTCKEHIIDSETLQAAPKIIPVIVRPQYYDYRDYSYPDYSLCCGENQVLVFKNDTGELVYKLNIEVNYNNKVVLLKDKVVVLNDNKLTVYPMFSGNPPYETTFERGNGNILSLTKHNDMVFVLHLNGSMANYLVFDCSNGIKNKGFFKTPDNNSCTQIALPEKNMQLFCSQSKVYAFNMQQMKVDFEFSIYNRRNVYLDNNRLIIVCEQNRIDHYNLFEDAHFKNGELIATLYTIPDGFLWIIPPDAASPHGWFWTDNPEYIEVMQYIDKKQDYELLQQTSVEWQKYIELHNRKDLVMSRLHNPETYINTLADLQNKLQHLQLKEFKHTLQLTGK